jgi:hypothetical protein
MCFAVPGFTFIPQTRSRSEAGMRLEAVMYGRERAAETSSLIAYALYWIHPASWAGTSNTS